jgi:hypothetical protein
MNRIIVLIALCALTLFNWKDVAGDSFTDTPTQEDEPERSWQVFGALTKHPDDSPLFVIDDIFHLQHEAGNGRSVAFKPFNMKNPGWNQYGSSKPLVFLRYPWPSPTTQYLCKVATFQGDSHLIVISRMAGHEETQIVIQYDHATKNSQGQCDNVTLPSHGGLAHAHAVR